MISGIGIDIENINRFEALSEEFLKLTFTDKEIEYCKDKVNPSQSFAGKFCAKEAIIKASDIKISVKDIEILNNEDGKVIVNLQGQRKENILCSISHNKDYAIALAIINES